MSSEHVEVVVRPTGQVLAVNPGTSLLDAFKANQVPTSFSCEDGRCGLCCCKLIRGRVLEAARPPRQRANTRSPYVLACQSSVVDNCIVELPEPDEVVVHRPRKVKAIVQSVEMLAKDVHRLRLDVPKDFTFSPGQFVEVQFNRQLVRVYSMANTGGDGTLEFHVQIHLQGRASGLIAEHIQRGDSLRVDGPLGTSYLRKKSSAPVICVASRTGLAPMLAVLRGMAEQDMQNPVHVYLGFMSAEQVYGLEELADAVAALPSVEAVHCVVATGRLDDGMRPGLLTQAISADFENLQGWRAYLFGSPHAIESTAKRIADKGVAQDMLVADPFQVTGD